MNPARAVAPMGRTLLVARLWFEGNRFSPRPTTQVELQQREWARGDSALAGAAGTATELAAVVDFAAAQAGRWQVVASRCASASPGGPLDDDVFEQWLREVLADAARVRPAAVYLSLHGAAITARRDSPELEIVQALRRALGSSAQLGASFDLHANLPPAIVEGLDAASGYRTYPHVDMRETAARVLERLRVQAESGGEGSHGVAAHGVVAPAGCLLPSFNMRTDAGPMRRMQDAARALESEPGIVDVSVFGGFPYADTVHAGGAVMVWANTRERAARHAAALAAQLSALAPQFAPQLLAPREALRTAAARGLQGGAGAVVAVTDPADNPLSGGAADTPGLFAALLAERRDAGSPLAQWPAGRIVFAYFADAQVVQRAHEAGPGAGLDASLGARLSSSYGPPVPWRARVLRLTDGRFVNTGPMERGSAVQLGRTALLEGDEGVQLVVTEAVGAANDPAFFALHGIELAAPLLLVVKAKNHFRAAFAPLCAAIVDAEVPGPAAADLSSLPFRYARPV